MSGIPIPVTERHKPFEKKSCARCLDDEFRIDGYCSIYCRDMAELETENEQYKDALQSIAGTNTKPSHLKKNWKEMMLAAKHRAKQALGGE